MVKKILVVAALAALAWSCATFEPLPPAFYVEDLPQSLTTEMTLEQRIAAEEAWNDLRTGRSERAGKAFAKLGPDSPVSRLGRGFLALQAQDLQAAEQGFKDALRLDPGLVLAQVGLAQVALARGDDDQAYSRYREVLKLEPDHAWAKPRFEALREQKTEQFMAEGRRAVDDRRPRGRQESLPLGPLLLARNPSRPTSTWPGSTGRRRTRRAPPSITRPRAPAPPRTRPS